MEKGMKLLFQVKPTSGVPIYRQIIEQVKRMVISGHLKPGDELPSVRQVAAYLEVNQMTISKAYSLLEATGVLERNRGKRMMVTDAQSKAGTLKSRLKLIRPALMETITQARQLALPKEALLNELTKLMEESNE